MTVGQGVQGGEAVANRSDMLVFDADAGGHRANYARIFARLTGSPSLIAPIPGALRRLLTVRYLILTTLETAPRAFLAILFLRSLMGRRSAVVSLRAHTLAARRGRRGLPARLGVRLLERLKPVLPLSLVPFGGSGAGTGFTAIRDPEFWDLEPADREAAETPLSEGVRAFAGSRHILLLIGYLDSSKGLDFLRDIFCGDPALLETIVPVLCGRVLPESQGVADELRACGAYVESRYLDHEELMSLYGAADAAWCCYPPERDLSSGIFGRAVQFGIAPVLRRGSVLEAMAIALPNAVRIDYGDVEGARASLRRPVQRTAPPPDRREKESEALRSRLFAHFGITAGLADPRARDGLSAP